MAEWLVPRTLEDDVQGSNPIEGRIQLMTVWFFIAQSPSLSPFHRLNMT